jgi:excisionase family DNA binding protein
VGDFLTVGNVAQDLHCSKGHVYAEIRAGRLRAAVINQRKDLRILRSWLLQYLERWSTEPRTPTEREVLAAQASAVKRAARRAAAVAHNVPQAGQDGPS